MDESAGFLDPTPTVEHFAPRLFSEVMKLALCLEYPIGLRGGVSVLVEALATGLREYHDLLLVSPDSAESLEASGVRSLFGEHICWEPTLVGRASSKSLAAALAKRGVRLAHFHFGGVFGWGNRFPFQSPIYYLSSLQIPCISTVHRAVGILDGFCGPQRSMWFKLLMLPLAWCGKAHQLRHVHFEIAVSQDNFRKLRRWYWPFRHRLLQIYHARLSEKFSSVTVRSREKIILNVGHIVQHKGQAVLAEAFAQIASRHSEWTLQFAGPDVDGLSMEPIRQIAKEYKLEARICLLGQRNDTLDLMGRAAIYVQPSFDEALGLALQEAMYCGCPCIGTSAGGIPELIRDGDTGVLVEPGAITQLSDSLVSLMDAEVRRERLGSAAAASIRARGMTLEEMAKHYLELYGRLAV